VNQGKKQDLSVTLREVVRLSEQMLALAQNGAEWADSVECGIIAGTLRDAGYQLRRLARRELMRQQWEAYAEWQGLGLVRQKPATARGGDPRETPPGGRAAGRKVLIVEDEPDVVTFLRTWFEDVGFETCCARDGEEGRCQALAEQPDLITLDLSMPKQPGDSYLSWIRAQRELKHIPLIVITAQGDWARRAGKESGAAGPDALLHKPIDLRELAVAVKRLVGQL
jgi:CheY-like chemotaxis protein